MSYENVRRLHSREGVELVSLTSEVALDISSYINGEEIDKKPIQYLSKLLHESTQGEEPLARNGSNHMLGDAIAGRENAIKRWRGIGSSDKVVIQTNLAAKDLRDFEYLSRERLETLRDFCVNLSREVRIEYEKYYSSRSRLVA